MNINNNVISNVESNLLEFSLISMKKGDQGTVMSACIHPLLAPLGFRKGKKLKIRAVYPFGGPIMAEIEDRSVAISRDIANNIFVRKWCEDVK